MTTRQLPISLSEDISYLLFIVHNRSASPVMETAPPLWVDVTSS